MATLYSDNFNRATLSTGGFWQAGENITLDTTATIVSSINLRMSSGSTPSMVRTTTTAHAATADMKVTITRITSGSGFDGGPVGRATGTNTYYYLDAYGTNTISLFRRVAGSDSASLGDRTSSHAANDNFSIEVSGTGATVTIRLYKNGVKLGADISDNNAARITAAGQSGVMSWVNVNQDYDDFLVEDLGGGGGGSVAKFMPVVMGI